MIRAVPEIAVSKKTYSEALVKSVSFDCDSKTNFFIHKIFFVRPKIILWKSLFGPYLKLAHRVILANSTIRIYFAMNDLNRHQQKD